MAMTSPADFDGAATASSPASRVSTKHGELTAALREMVAGMRPGERLPTQDELMRRFGVSDTTVLRSLGDLRREGRIVRRQGSGTFVADPAAAAAPSEAAPVVPTPAPVVHPGPSRRPRMVAVLAEQSGNLFFTDMIEAVEASLGGHDLAPLLIMDRDLNRRLGRAREYWQRGDIVGAIHVGSVGLDAAGDMPTILVGESETDHEHCQVSLDNVGAGKLVGEYLWDLGHRRVAAIAVAPDPLKAPHHGVDHLRMAGLRAFWEERGGFWDKNSEIVHPHLLGPDDGRSIQILRAHLEPLFQAVDSPPPTAIFAGHDEMAAATIRALEAMDLQVPGDVSVVGFNDLGMLAAYFRPSLTTVRTPAPTLGTLAVHLLLDLLRHPEHKPRSVRLPAEIIVRESTAPPPSKAALSTAAATTGSAAPAAPRAGATEEGSIT